MHRYNWPRLGINSSSMWLGDQLPASTSMLLLPAGRMLSDDESLILYVIISPSYNFCDFLWLMSTWGNGWENRRGLTWLASKYSSKLKAAPAQAVSSSTPVFLTIWDVKGKIRNRRGRYWKKTMKPRMFLVASAVLPTILGVMIHITSCIPTPNEQFDRVRTCKLVPQSITWKL